MVAGPNDMGRFLLTNPLDPMDELAEALRGTFSTGINEAQKAGLVPVLSHERISGNPHRGGRDAKHFADQLHEAFPGSRILMIVREQSRMLVSLYNTYVRMGGTASLKEYTFAKGGGGEPPLFRLDFLEYHRLISYYQSLFGPDKVLVLPYELLEVHPQGFSERLINFSGAESLRYPRVKRVNISPSAATIAIKRRINKLFVYNTFNPAPLLPLRVDNMMLRRLSIQLDKKIPDKVREASDHHMQSISNELVGERYRESNALTANLARLNLNEFGYPC